MKRLKKGSTQRRATAIVEAALMAPLMLVGTLGITEVGYIYMAKQTVTLAAREGARAGVLPGSTSSDGNDVKMSGISQRGASPCGWCHTNTQSYCSTTDHTRRRFVRLGRSS